MEEDNKKPYKIKDVTRAIKKAVVAGTLDEVRAKAAEKFGRPELPNIHLDSDGTEVDDEDYFQTLEANAELIVVFPGEQWIDPTHYVTITTHKESGDITDSPEVERIHLKKLVAQMKSNLCNVSVLSEPDLELLSNMDPNSVADITGRDFIEQLKEASGRILHEKRQALDAIELLKLIAKQKVSIPSIVHNIPGGDDDGNDGDDNDNDDSNYCVEGSLGGVGGDVGGNVIRYLPAAADELDSANRSSSNSSSSSNSGKQIILELDPRTLATFQQQISTNASRNTASVAVAAAAATTAVADRSDTSADNSNRGETSNI
ncbi:DNA fragmentation factor subunit alpha-like isoform X1 [Topomyia yanbarensis]|uniref:DNA fragmentation factor subunit alpha-like isoform X1 n=1 Tax=Topomyia yanbarensis TaxID=2498891 RepID=UPI00273CAE25|nr:DNA fragmentation factor subunit alpha-like isoform X1 [Topomyia yanbarensis]